MVLKNLLSFAKKNKRIFIIFLLVQIVTLIAFFSVFNYGMKLTEDMKENRIECRTYSVYISDTGNLDTQMKTVYEKYADKISRLYVSINQNDDVIYAEYINNAYENDIGSGKNFQEDNFYSGEKQILADGSFDLLEGREYSIGSEYNLFGNKYQVIGILETVGYYVIPYSSLENKDNVSKVSVVMNCDLTSLQGNIMEENLKSIFGSEEVEKPQAYELYVYSNSINYIMTFAVVIVIAFINMIYLYYYLLNRRKKEFAVLRVCGCSINKAVSMYFIEVLLLSVITYIIALVLHLLCVMPIMTGLTNYISYYISPFQFIVIYILYLATEIVSFVPVMIKFSKIAPSILTKD